MPNTMKALQRAAKAAMTKSYVQFTAEGTPVICSQCRGDKFYVSVPSLRNIAGFSLECERCSHLEYFQKKPTELSEQV
jgi:hypothetical protein